MILTIAAAAWCDQAALMLASSIRGAPCYTIDDMRLEVERGGAHLYAITDEAAGEVVAYVVLRIERYQGGAEGVIVAGAGKLAGGHLYRDIVPALERMFKGVRSYRIESCRRGAAGILLEQGYSPTHVIFRKAAPAERQPIAGDDRLEELAGVYQEAQHGDGRRGSAGGDLRARPGKLHGGGGGSSSSSSTQNTVNTDRRLVTDNGAVAVSSDNSTVTINTLDAGAIQKAFDFATASEMDTGKTLQGVLGVAAQVFDQGSKQIEAGSQLVASAYDNAKGAGDLKYMAAAAAIAVVAIVAIKAFKK